MFREHFGVVTFKTRRLREAPQRRGGVANSNIARKLLKPLYGLSTACKDWYKTIRDFLAKECGPDVTSVNESVFSPTQQGFDYGYGVKFRDPNLPHPDIGILKVNDNFETDDKREVLGIIAIRVSDLMISGSDLSIVYISTISFRIKAGFVKTFLFLMAVYDLMGAKGGWVGRGI